MKKFILPSLLVFALGTGLSACSNADEKLSKNLDGVWDSTSYTIDGEQQIPTVIANFVMDFSDTGDGSGTAIFSTFRVNYSTFPPSEIKLDESVTYTTQAGPDDTDILFVVINGQEAVYDMELRKDFITLTFERDGSVIRIKSDKR